MPIEGPAIVIWPIFRCFRISAQLLYSGEKERGRVGNRGKYRIYAKLTWFIIPMDRSPLYVQCSSNQLVS
jgi:hypothetical protein